MKSFARNATYFVALGLLFANASIAQPEGDDSEARSAQRQAAQRFSQIPRGVPIVMLNMLNFRDAADYLDGGPPATGEQAYAKYRAEASKLVAKVGGAPVWSGDAKAAVIAPDNEHWDEVLLVRYPSLEAFFSMINSEAYQAIVFHRTAALEDSRLIATVENSK